MHLPTADAGDKPQTLNLYTGTVMKTSYKLLAALIAAGTFGLSAAHAQQGPTGNGPGPRGPANAAPQQTEAHAALMEKMRAAKTPEERRAIMQANRGQMQAQGRGERHEHSAGASGRAGQRGEHRHDGARGEGRGEGRGDGHGKRGQGRGEQRGHGEHRHGTS